jgi:hypothetical protein
MAMIRKFTALCFISLVGFLAGPLGVAPASVAQEAKSASPSPAPIPAPILVAKTLFITNGGLDGPARDTLDSSHTDPRIAYNKLYSSLQQGKRFALASSPSGADLVLQVSLSSDLDFCRNTASYLLLANLTVYDARTHFLLWTFSQPIEHAIRDSTWQKNITSAVDRTVLELQKLAGPKS